MLSPILLPAPTLYPRPQAIIVAHSMGTLVAQYFLECMPGADVTLMHVAVGPPFRGSVLGMLSASDHLLRDPHRTSDHPSKYAVSDSTWRSFAGQRMAGCSPSCAPVDKKQRSSFVGKCGLTSTSAGISRLCMRDVRVPSLSVHLACPAALQCTQASALIITLPWPLYLQASRP